MKQLDSQLPYFGGSVEYGEGHVDELEFWMYHLSTLTRDPARLLPSAEFGSVQLPKPLQDYRTRIDGLVPFMNQRNLGSGIAESYFNELPESLRATIEKRLGNFMQGVVERGGDTDRAGQRRWADLARAYESAAVKFNGAASATEKKVPSHTLTPKQLWDYSSEDDRKAVYGKVLELAWSAAHLASESSHFARSYEPSHSSSRSVRGHHPESQQGGLRNVAGVFGNILETPFVASVKYAAEGGKRLQDLQHKGELAKKFPGSVSQHPILLEFHDRHDAWHKNAYDNHRPIVGGISGHTLGYLNLYADALNTEGVTAAETADLPSPELLRAILLGGLVGRKRHHSYDEVMTASTAVAFATPLTYSDKKGYGDLSESTDPKLREVAAEARARSLEGYSTHRAKTVLRTLLNAAPSGSEAQQEAVQQAAKNYFAALGAPGRAGADSLKTAKALIHVAVSDLVNGPPARGEIREDAADREGETSRQGRKSLPASVREGATKLLRKMAGRGEP